MASTLALSVTGTGDGVTSAAAGTVKNAGVPVGNVAVAISWGNYFKTLLASFGIMIPDWLTPSFSKAASTT